MRFSYYQIHMAVAYRSQLKESSFSCFQVHRCVSLTIWISITRLYPICRNPVIPIIFPETLGKESHRKGFLFSSSTFYSFFITWVFITLTILSPYDAVISLTDSRKYSHSNTSSFLRLWIVSLCITSFNQTLWTVNDN